MKKQAIDLAQQTDAIAKIVTRLVILGAEPPWRRRKPNWLQSTRKLITEKHQQISHLRLASQKTKIANQ